MTYAVDHYMDLGDQDLPKRLTRFLEAQYTDNKACRLAADIDCDPRTAKNILDRHWPNARNMRAIVRRFGRDVIEAVFSPEVEPVLARLAAEERALAAKLEQKRAHLRQVAGVGARMEEPAASAAHRFEAVARRSANGEAA